MTITVEKHEAEAGQTELAGLARSLAETMIQSDARICTMCQMGTYGDMEIPHTPSCLVGRVLRAARAANPLEEEFFRNEGRER